MEPIAKAGRVVRSRDSQRALALLILIILAACGSGVPRSQSRYYVVVDPSASRHTAALIASTTRSVGEVLDEALNSNGHLVVTVLGRTQGSSQVIFDGNLTPEGPNGIYKRADAARLRASTLATVTSALQS